MWKISNFFNWIRKNLPFSCCCMKKLKVLCIDCGKDACFACLPYEKKFHWSGAEKWVISSIGHRKIVNFVYWAPKNLEFFELDLKKSRLWFLGKKRGANLVERHEKISLLSIGYEKKSWLWSIGFIRAQIWSIENKNIANFADGEWKIHGGSAS